MNQRYAGMKKEMPSSEQRFKQQKKVVKTDVEEGLHSLKKDKNFEHNILWIGSLVKFAVQFPPRDS